jgi:crotonobetainyl-CoA:carnitine CoA-transferase CaiB-like acyl-CoA transferase
MSTEGLNLPMAGPLAGLRVIDLTRGTAGPRAAGMLADYGADVVWVEPPGGDPYRDELAVPYASFNRGKRSVTIDLKGDQEPLHRLLGTADAVIQSWRPGVAERLGLGYDDLHRRHPHLVVTSITGFGPDEPVAGLPGHEALVHSLVGTMAEQVGVREPPIYEGLPFASIGAAYLACIGTLAALLRRDGDGIGRQVETSLVDGALAYLSMTWGDSDDADAMPKIVPGVRRIVSRSFECADGEFLGMHTGAVGAFGRLMVALGTDDRIPPDPRGADLMLPLDDEQRKLIAEELPKIFKTQPRSYWLDKLLAADICVVPELHATQVFDEPQARHNNMVLRLDDPVLGTIDVAAPPVRFSAHPDPSPRPAPIPGADTGDVLSAAAEPVTMSAATANGDGPLLAGIKVLDLGAYFAGPYSSRLLADLGADVIKLETTLGDQLRALTRPFTAAQAGKRAVSFDLKDPELSPALRGLIEWADVIHHNLRPGAADRLGVGYEQVRALNPRAVYLYAPGWGSTGPDSLRQSFAPMLAAYTGTSYEVAGQFNPPMWPIGNEDPGNGLVGAIAVLIGLLDRQRSGRGQYIENPQLNAAIVHLQHIVRTATGEVIGAELLDPVQLGVSPLDRLYQASEGWIVLVAKSRREISALSAVTGVEILGDERFATSALRKANEYELASLLGDIFAAKTSAEWVAALQAAGVGAVEPVVDNVVARFHREPVNLRTGRIGQVSDGKGGVIRLISQLVRVSESTPMPLRLAPALGADSDAVLTELGYSTDQIAELRTRGSVR